ncbi:hypothetical protein [Mycolicibacterium mageritense]|uniref:hypothetical protein n=1 Tax=Mycolicibacterium mageritense TaxID=53462 RepID=UPI001E4DD615|nr:hypothetical protein [Mycolicibacterium mageritense]GJJ22425.1 hypothetical protein MTY414_60980 [Mycolicibacterium mageritense]
MSGSNEDNGSENRNSGGRWLGLTPYQQILLLPPILYLGGTLAIPGVRPELSVAGGALVLVMVLVGLFWPGAAGRRSKRGGHDGDESQDPDSR